MIEIERRFLVSLNGINPFANRTPEFLYQQGYFKTEGYSNRVRLQLDFQSHKPLELGHHTLTYKFKQESKYLGKEEIEVNLTVEEAVRLFNHTETDITKYRHLVEVPGYPALFEVDVFLGPLEGLVIAELEKPLDMDDDAFLALKKPDFAVRELTHIKGWSNRKLSKLDSLDDLRLK